MTPNSAPSTPASAKARSRNIVLPRPPPPGLSATSAKASAGNAGSFRHRERLRDRLVERGQLRIEPGALIPAILRDLGGERCGGRPVAARGHDDAEPVLRGVGISEA